MTTQNLIIVFIAVALTGCELMDPPLAGEAVHEAIEGIGESPREPEPAEGHEAVAEPHPTENPGEPGEGYETPAEPGNPAEERPHHPEEPPIVERACGDFEEFDLHPEGAPLRYRNGNEVRGWDPSVIVEQETGLYRAFFGNPVGNKMALFSATSRDGVTWTAVNRGRPVFPGRPGEWDAAIETNTVLERDGVFHMWYLGYPCYIPEGLRGRNKCIGHATSADGVTWDRDPEPVMEPEFAFEQPFPRCHGGGPVEGCEEQIEWEGGIQEPSVVWDEDEGLFKMWYTGTTMTTIEYQREGELQTRTIVQSKVGYATSANGVDWDRRPEPVFEWSAEQYGIESWTFPVHTNVTPDPGGGYHLFYIGMYDLRHAYSPDGINWFRNPTAALPSRGEPGRIIELGGPSAVWTEEGGVELFHMMGTPGARRYGGLGMRLGLATGDCVEP